ncbi:MAG: hypothetical protein K5666_00760 [Bacilli bacterium]|nr:hypothetical protein [Bacilli bacterium]
MAYRDHYFMDYEKVENIKGIKDVIEKLKTVGVEVNSIDMNIAEAIFKLIPKTVRRTVKDMDGYDAYPVEAYVYVPELDSLIRSFPNAARLLASLGHDNYSFVLPNGEERSTVGMGSEYSIIHDAAQAVLTYMYESNRIYKNEQEYENAKRAKEDADFRRRFGDGSDYNYEYNYNYNEAGTSRR